MRMPVQLFQSLFAGLFKARAQYRDAAERWWNYADMCRVEGRAHSADSAERTAARFALRACLEVL